MSGRQRNLENTIVSRISMVTAGALLCVVISMPALSQVYEDTNARDQAASEDIYQRFEAERRRQERVRLENQRRQEEKMRLETERLRQENERSEQERLRLENEQLREENKRREQEWLLAENERLRQVNERHEFEQLVLETATRERERARTAALLGQTAQSDQIKNPDVYEQLRALGQLKDDGILTDKEFQVLKKRILD